MNLTVETIGQPPAHGAFKVLRDEVRKAATDGVLMHEAEWKRRASRARKTGTMLRSITHRVEVHGDKVEAWTGTNLAYARYLEQGTGLYGPRHRWIIPKTRKALAFHPTGAAGGRNVTLAGRARKGREAQARAGMVVVRRVRGIRPRRFAYDASLVVQPRVHKRFVQAGEQFLKRIAAGEGRA